MNTDNTKYCFEEVVLDSMTELFKGKMLSIPESAESIGKLLGYIEMMRQSNQIYSEIMNYIASTSVKKSDSNANSFDIVALHEQFRQNGIPKELRSIYLRLKFILKDMSEQDVKFIATMKEAEPYLSGIETMFCHSYFYSSWQILQSIEGLFEIY